MSKKNVGKYYVQLFDSVLAGTIGEKPGVCIFGETCGMQRLCNLMEMCMPVIIMFFQNIKC